MLFFGARIIIAPLCVGEGDEPTSTLSPPEAERLFDPRVVCEQRAAVFASHFLDDVLTICVRVTVFAQ